MHNIWNLFYFGTTLYMFRMVSLRPSSGVQDCTYSIRCMSYRFFGCLLAGMRWNWLSSISFPLASSYRTCMTYTWCCMYSLRLLMMDGERPSETCRALFQNKINFRYCTSSWFYGRSTGLFFFPKQLETERVCKVNVCMFAHELIHFQILLLCTFFKSLQVK
jgi:hypothetical protein